MREQEIKAFAVDSFPHANDEKFEEDTSLTGGDYHRLDGGLDLIAFLESDFSVSMQDEDFVPEEEDLDSIDNPL